MDKRTFRYPKRYKGMYWYGVASVSTMMILTIREIIFNFSILNIRELPGIILIFSVLIYAEVFLISRLLHLGETICVDETGIRYFHRNGQIVSMLWDEIATLEYQQISCLLILTAPNPSRTITVDNRMGDFIDLLNHIQREMNKFPYKRRIRLVEK